MGRPKPLLQVIRENPDMANSLIIMPLDASNAGKNYGTGGDFTANSAPYVGARGGSEFWARSVNCHDAGGATKYLYNNTTMNTASKTYSCVFSHKLSDNYPSSYPIAIAYSGLTGALFVTLNFTDNKIIVKGTNSSNTIILDISTTLNDLVYGNWYTYFISIDMDGGHYIADSRGKISEVISIYTNDTFPTSRTKIGAGYSAGSTTLLSGYGENAFTYFTTDYIDFSQETNRNKFVDQLGYPKDLKAQIDAGVIPTPLIYLPFDEPTNLGKNLGTGGYFTVNGTVTAGADVLG